MCLSPMAAHVFPEEAKHHMGCLTAKAQQAASSPEPQEEIKCVSECVTYLSLCEAAVVLLVQ